MARHLLKRAIILLAVLVIGACGGYGSIIEVLRGNLAYGRGDYQTALVHYMVAVEDAPSDAWTRFNIGNVYYALGEHDAALEIWHDARRAVEDDDEAGVSELPLIYAASYNRGVLLYQQGQYAAAYDELRYALSVNSRSPAAKANLELALNKLQAANSAAANAGTTGGVSAKPPDGPSDDGPGEQTLRILEYVRRKETQQWFANREIESQDQPQDW
ncbi:MAG: tetratricopeptide repeat protein [Spirochaetia bacterium]